MATSDDLCWLPASQMASAIKRRKLSPVEVMKAVLARIERLNPRLNAFVTLTADQALKDARAAERAVMKKGATLGPLHGVPFSTKDLVITRASAPRSARGSSPTTCRPRTRRWWSACGPRARSSSARPTRR